MFFIIKFAYMHMIFNASMHKSVTTTYGWLHLNYIFIFKCDEPKKKYLANFNLVPMDKMDLRLHKTYIKESYRNKCT